MLKPLAITVVAMGVAVAAPVESASAHSMAVRIDAPEFGIRIGLPVPPLFIPAPVVVAPPRVIVSPPPRVVVAPAPAYYPAPVYRVDYPRYERPRHRHWDERRGRWSDDDHDSRRDARRHRWD